MFAERDQRAADAAPVRGRDGRVPVARHQVLRAEGLAHLTPADMHGLQSSAGNAAVVHALGRQRQIQRMDADGGDYMSSAQQDHFRRLLLEWRGDLLREAGDTMAIDGVTQQDDVGFELSQRDRQRKLIKKIDDALLALDQSLYGYCGACGAEIGLRRLEARPIATRCADCSPR